METYTATINDPYIRVSHPGTTYDVTTTTFGESTGGPILPPFAGLQWGLNHNVLIDIPAGYAAALPSGCSQPDTSQVACTITTGPFTS